MAFGDGGINIGVVSTALGMTFGDDNAGGISSVCDVGVGDVNIGVVGTALGLTFGDVDVDGTGFGMSFGVDDNGVCMVRVE
jgi:hypothetical protein